MIFATDDQIRNSMDEEAIEYYLHNPFFHKAIDTMMNCGGTTIEEVIAIMKMICEQNDELSSRCFELIQNSTSNTIFRR